MFELRFTSQAMWEIDLGDENNNELHMNLLSLVSIKVVRSASTWLQTRFLNFSGITWSLHSSNDRRYSYFTKKICNQYIDSFKIIFGVRSETCPAIVMTM